MLEDTPANEPTGGAPAPEATAETAPAKKAPAKKAAAKKATTRPPAKKAAAKKTTAKKAAAQAPAASDAGAPRAEADTPGETPAPKVAKKTSAKKAPAKKATTKAVAPEPDAGSDAASGTALLFQPPPATPAPARASRKAAASGDEAGGDAPEKPAQKKTQPKKSDQQKSGQQKSGQQKSGQQKSGDTDDDQTADGPGQGKDGQADTDDGEGGGGRRRRRRGGRRRRKSGDGNNDQGGGDQAAGDQADSGADSDSDDAGDDDNGGGEGSTRRRRRRRRAGEEGDGNGDDPAKTVTKVRQGRSPEDQITAVSGSTRLEAKKQRRREGREAGRRRAPIVSEAEFLARREAVERVMVIRQRKELTQIAVIEDKVLVEHYVARESQTSLIGNVYLGRVQNVLPSMEAAFIDIGKGRNAVLYAGEVNWSALGHKDGQPRKIESVLSSGQAVLVQVTKDPIGHKGARLTSQISLAGRFLVYVPDGTTSGISRKLPDTERSRLKTLLKEIVPDSAGVIVRTAAEGASEDELTRDVERLKARWEDIEVKAKGNGPKLLYGEPDLTLKVVRDLFTEDISKLVIEGDDAWDTVQSYVAHVAPDLEDRLERFEPATEGKQAGKDVFGAYRLDEQIAKALDRKVWLPSGGSLIIDRTEAMTVVDVNTGKFTGSGGNLEETVTKNNLEAAEEVVRQLRLRDIGGIIVIDFIDMVLESNRDLVLRRLVECLGRDRTRHQVAEVTSLGLVQMTRKRIGTGLLEAFSENCEHCQGRGVVIQDAPVEQKKVEDDSRRGGRRGRGGRGRGDGDGDGAPKDNGGAKSAPSPKDVAAMARPENADKPPADSPEAETAVGEDAVESGSKPVDDAPAAVTETTDAEAPTRTPRPAASEPAPEASAPAEPAQDEPSSEPVTPTVPAEPEKPKVVTRTRRRSASRPAGPPAGAEADPTGEPDAAPAPGSTGSADEGSIATPAPGAIGAPPESGTVEPGTAVTEPGTDSSPSAVPVVEHVPVKKKGSRKR